MSSTLDDDSSDSPGAPYPLQPSSDDITTSLRLFRCLKLAKDFFLKHLKVWFRGPLIVHIAGMGETIHQLEAERQRQDATEGTVTSEGNRLQMVEIDPSQMSSLNELELIVSRAVLKPSDATNGHCVFPDYRASNMEQRDLLVKLCCYELSAETAIVCAGVIQAIGDAIDMAALFADLSDKYDVFNCGTYRPISSAAFYNTPPAQPASQLVSPYDSFPSVIDAESESDSNGTIHIGSDR